MSGAQAEPLPAVRRGTWWVLDRGAADVATLEAAADDGAAGPEASTIAVASSVNDDRTPNGWADRPRRRRSLWRAR